MEVPPEGCQRSSTQVLRDRQGPDDDDTADQMLLERFQHAMYRVLSSLMCLALKFLIVNPEAAGTGCVEF